MANRISIGSITVTGPGAVGVIVGDFTFNDADSEGSFESQDIAVGQHADVLGNVNANHAGRAPAGGVALTTSCSDPPPPYSCIPPPPYS